MSYNNFGVVDENGKEVLPIGYEKIDFLTPKYFLVTKNKKKGIVNFSNQTIVPLEYDCFIKQESTSFIDYNPLFERENIIGVVYKTKRKKHQIYYVSIDGTLTEATAIDQAKVEERLNKNEIKY